MSEESGVRIYKVPFDSLLLTRMFTEGSERAPHRVIEGLPAGCRLEKVDFVPWEDMVYFYFGNEVARGVNWTRAGELEERIIRLEFLR